MPNFRIRSVTLRVLAESIGKIITIETTPGILYKGKLVSVERNMDCKLADVTFTDTNGTESYLNNAYVRGRKIVVVILPEMSNNAPVFNSGGNNGNVGAGQGARGRGRDRGRGRRQYRRRRGPASTEAGAAANRDGQNVWTASPTTEAEATANVERLDVWTPADSTVAAATATMERLNLWSTD